MNFFQALYEYEWLQRAVAVGLLASLAYGIMGSYVVVRRISYIAGGVAHSVLAGLGGAFFFSQKYGMPGLKPLYGAIVVAILSALIIGIVSLRARERADTVIGAIWAIGFAGGIFFQQFTPGNPPDLTSYLFGNILMVSPADLWLIAGLDLIVVVFALLFYNQFLAVIFDEEFAEVRGLRTRFLYLFLLCLTALAVVMLVTVVGVVMVIALFTLPAAIAGMFSRTLWQMMLIAVVLTAAFTTSGIAISFAADLPSGASIILLTGGVYLLVAVAVQIVKTFRTRRRVRTQQISEKASAS